jgi:hypothetical protein
MGNDCQISPNSLGFDSVAQIDYTLAMALWSTSQIPTELRARYSILIARVDEQPGANIRCRDCEIFIGRQLARDVVLDTIHAHERDAHAQETAS